MPNERQARAEEKLNSIHETVCRVELKLDLIEGRLRVAERVQSWIIGIGVGVSAIFSWIIKNIHE